MSKFRRQLMMARMGEPVPPTPVLPYDAEVEWLETDGNAWIDTGVKTSSNLRFDITMVLPDSIGNAWLFGSRSGANAGQMAFLSSATNGKDWRYGTKSSLNSGLLKGEHNFKNSPDRNVLIIDGTTSISATNSTFSTNYTFYLFTFNANGTASTSLICDGVKMLPSKIYVSGVLERDYICVRKDGVGYLYDKVSETLFGNANSVGAFRYGNDKTT